MLANRLTAGRSRHALRRGPGAWRLPLNTFEAAGRLHPQRNSPRPHKDVDERLAEGVRGATFTWLSRVSRPAALLESRAAEPPLEFRRGISRLAAERPHPREEADGVAPMGQRGAVRQHRHPVRAASGTIASTRSRLF